jgi:FixJ family two-component response regulator
MANELNYQTFLNRDRLIQIVDADASTCEALSVLFRLEGYQTRFALDAVTFLADFERREPDAVLLNLMLAGESGIEVMRRIKAMRVGLPVFILADRPEVDGAVEAMKAGAQDVVTKPIDSDRLLGTVREALSEEVHIGTVQAGRRAVEVRGFAQLTPREREVLQLITNGRSNKQAGRELGISPRTIEVHRARVMEKLGARNTADLMRIVLTR